MRIIDILLTVGGLRCVFLLLLTAASGFTSSYRSRDRITTKMSVAGLGSYLRDVATKMRGPSSFVPGAKLRVVMGNEASDADSIVSSLCYAYLLAQRHATAHPDNLYVPIMPITASEFQMRRETVLLTEIAGIRSADIIFSDEVDLHSYHGIGKLEITLTDHNYIRSELQPLEEAVVEIIDHHEDLGRHPGVVGEARKIAFADGKATVASACTQIAEEYLGAAGPAVDSAAATLLLAVIALDSANFDEAAGKVTSRDVAAADALKPFITEYPPDNLYPVLQAAKRDLSFWGGIPVADCLKYDFKLFKAGEGRAGELRLGMSSMLEPMSTVMEKPGFLEAVNSFYQDRHLDVIIIMTSQFEPEKRRQIFIYSAEAALVAGLSRHLAADAVAALGLRGPGPLPPSPPGGGGEGDGEARMASFEQENVKASRKQVAPAALRYLEDVAAQRQLQTSDDEQSKPT